MTGKDTEPINTYRKRSKTVFGSMAQRAASLTRLEHETGQIPVMDITSAKTNFVLKDKGYQHFRDVTHELPPRQKQVFDSVANAMTAVKDYESTIQGAELDIETDPEFLRTAGNQNDMDLGVVPISSFSRMAVRINVESIYPDEK